ncbi:MAG: hypothetical protein RL189_495 [Pseudomonadota bacterium]
MSTRVKKNDIRSSLFDEVDMQQRAIEEARVSHALEMGGALKRGREEQKIADVRALIAERLLFAKPSLMISCLTFYFL